MLDLASTLTTTSAEDEADAENVRFLRRLMDTNWSPQDAEANEDAENDTWLPLEDVLLSENRDRILPVPVPEQYRTLDNSTTHQGQNDTNGPGLPSAIGTDPGRRRTGSQRFAAERDFLERTLSRQRNQRSDRGMQDDEVERVVRLQGILSRLNRLQEPAYGDRIPSQQSLYDWAPANNDDDGEELEDILRELRQQQPNTHPEILRVLGRSQLDAEREARNRAHSSRFLNTHAPPHPHSSESSLRSAAILQSVRRHPRFAARSRDSLQRHMMDRERTSNDNEDRDRSNSRWMRPLSLESTRYELNRLAWQTQQRLHEYHSRDGQTRPDNVRRNHTDNSCQNLPTNPRLEAAIQYLSQIRDSTCYEQSLSHAVDGGFVTKDFFGDQHDDFILDPELLSPPPPSSWLAPGMIFEGSQQATAVVTSSSVPQSFSTSHSTSNTTTYRLPNNQSITSTTFDRAISRPGSSDFDASRPWLSHTFVPPAPSHEFTQTPNSLPTQDNWPVRVTIHTVDYDSMTLSGTMEAFNVPSQPPNLLFPNTTSNSINNSNAFASFNAPVSGPIIPPTAKPITTYLEGEILDFAHYHSLRTTAFPADLPTDACYWRKLPPFSSVDEQSGNSDDLVRKLLSRRGMAQLHAEWILMRWKERGFVRTVGRDAWGRYASSGSTGQEREQQRDGDSGDGEAAAGGMEAEKTGAGGAALGEGHGLTISGFYYVCMRRSDGRIEGLYYDPQSSPYQHLRLSPLRAPGMGLAASGLR